MKSLVWLIVWTVCIAGWKHITGMEFSLELSGLIIIAGILSGVYGFELGRTW